MSEQGSQEVIDRQPPASTQPMDEVRQSRRMTFIEVGLVASLALTGIAACSNDGGEHEAASAETPTTAAEAGEDNSPEARNFWADLEERAPDFRPGEVNVGSQVEWGENPEERGTAAFTSETIESPADIVAFFGSGTPESEEVVSMIEETFEDDPENLERALSGEGYVPVQFNVPIAIEGTTYFVNGESEVATGERFAQAGDILWLYADEDGHIVWDASFRADCANPEITFIRPLRPGDVIPPSIVIPPGEVPPNPPVVTIPPKHDDGELPGDDTPASQDPGTPDRPGQGPAGQTPDDSGYLPGEEPPSPPSGGGSDNPPPPPPPPPPATTTPPPASTNPPVTATSVTPTSTPGGSMPGQP